MLGARISNSLSGWSTALTRPEAAALPCRAVLLLPAPRLAGEMAAAEDVWHHHAHSPGSHTALCNIKGLFINYFLHGAEFGMCY